MPPNAAGRWRHAIEGGLRGASEQASRREVVGAGVVESPSTVRATVRK
jgi:hypothetical protein